ncbi:MAG: DUF2207 domain-containing protein [Elusimicrobiaceae bacterium]|nr:DUF2207 domain-containing protein [Elusimicrobiaceae bacterium]
MKILRFLFLSLWFVLLFGTASYAQGNPSIDPEKIYLFSSNIAVHNDGTITITEDITLNVKHQQIRRGIFRAIPISKSEKVHIISLTMDGAEHPFFTEKEGSSLTINFGNDDYISKGKHTYSLIYSYTGAIDFFKNYDELYWNVTGNDWAFPIDKVRVQVAFPPEVNILQDGISIYTGRRGSKDNQTVSTGNLAYETTTSLRPGEEMTIAIPFDKGVVQPPPLIFRLFSWLPFYISLMLLVWLALYCIKTWKKVGRDPFYVGVAQYEPPAGISPAFMSYMHRRRTRSDMLACAMLDLAMKGYIEIKNESKDITLSRKKADTENLPKEEEDLLTKLFTQSDNFIINKKAGDTLQSLVNNMVNDFKKKEKSYVVSNAEYTPKAFLLLIALGIIPIVCAVLLGLLEPLGLILCLFPNLNPGVFIFFGFYSLLSSRPKLGLVLMFVFVYFVGRIASAAGMIAWCEFLFMVGLCGTVLYIWLIPNVTPLGKEFFEYLEGFKKYIKIAEVHRVAASNPLEAERIFCNYLPFAFALGMHNQWMKNFTGILSTATIGKCIECAGGTSTVSRELTKHISYSMSTSRGDYSSGSSHHSSGSYGGGHSGGGHGGGGGGGR